MRYGQRGVVHKAPASEYSREVLRLRQGDQSAKQAGEGLRREFSQWMDIGEALMLAKRHSAGEGGSKAHAIRCHAILKDQGLNWLATTGRRAIRYLTDVMSNREAVERWRNNLSDAERLKWQSPHSVYARCPVFHPNTKQTPAIKAKPLLLNDVMRLPSEEIALLLYRRAPVKMFAIYRAMTELVANGSAVKPPSGWPMTKQKMSTRESASVAAA
jgi:hypothetical protein